MNKYSILFSAFLGFQGFALGDEPGKEVDEPMVKQESTMAVTLSPFQLFILSIDGKYAFKVHDRVAITVPFLIHFVPSNSILREIAYFSSGAGARYHFMNRALESGLYAELGIAAGYSQLTPVDMASFSSVFLRPNALIGYSIVLSNGFTLNMAGGAFYNHAFSDEAPVLKKASSILQWGVPLANYTTSTQGLTSGFAPVAEFSLGYTW